MLPTYLPIYQGGGKTYTMVGTRDSPGIMIRALNHLFNEVEADTEAAHKVFVRDDSAHTHTYLF